MHSFRFHFAMYAGRLGISRGKVLPVSGAPIKSADGIPHRRNIFFWVPNETPGSMIIIDNVLPQLREEITRLGLDWKVGRGSKLPDFEVDWLVCFKSVPTLDQVAGNPQRILLICDQAEVFWKDVPMFHEVVATSSMHFAELMAWRSGKAYFISESEPELHLNFGQTILDHPSETQGNVLLWHGNSHSLKALYELKPTLIEWAETNEACLHVISGQNEQASEQWGQLEVRHFPWSKNQLRESARKARLAIIPAIRRLKHSWIKPPSRVRCCYSLGVPAIGDRRVPAVAAFCGPFNGPMAFSAADWLSELQRLWSDIDELNRLARAGHEEVRANHSTSTTARKWIRYFAKKS